MTEAQLRMKIRHDIALKRVKLALLESQIEECSQTDVLRRRRDRLDERISAAWFKLSKRYSA